MNRQVLAALALLSAGGCSDDPEPKTTSVTSSTGSGVVLPEPAEHRAEAVMCTGTPRPGNAIPGAGTACAQDGDCTAGDNGRCNWPYGGDNVCMYDECFQDADCGGVSGCACRIEQSFEMNRCFQGNCVLDGDCGTGGWCSPSAVDVSPSCMEGIAPGSVGFFCHTAQDECTDAADCPDPQGFVCLYSVEKAHYVCHALLCTN